MAVLSICPTHRVFTVIAQLSLSVFSPALGSTLSLSVVFVYVDTQSCHFYVPSTLPVPHLSLLPSCLHGGPASLDSIHDVHFLSGVPTCQARHPAQGAAGALPKGALSGSASAFPAVSLHPPLILGASRLR